MDKQEPGRRRIALTVLAMVVAAAASASQVSADAARQTTFHTETHAAMDRMMNWMDVPPSGSVDRDFAAMMIPHHQGAIDMAVAELKHGKNKILRRIAQEIVVTQRQEIEVMRRELDSLSAAGAASGANTHGSGR